MPYALSDAHSTSNPVGNYRNSVPLKEPSKLCYSASAATGGKTTCTAIVRVDIPLCEALTTQCICSGRVACGCNWGCCIILCTAGEN